MKIPPDNYSFRLFECSNKYEGNKKYFNDLAECLANPLVQRAFFQFLMGRDLSAYPWDFKNWECQSQNISDQTSRKRKYSGRE
jgi:hypothetical protein